MRSRSALITAALAGAAMLVSIVVGTAAASAATTIHFPTTGIAKFPGGGVIKLPPGPLSPGVYQLQAMPLAVTIRWYDRSTNEQKFILYKRTLTGAWRDIYETPTRDSAGTGTNYSYVDSDRSVSGQCYMIAAVNQDGAGYTKEQCTVRPDPSRFPQTIPSKVKQWFGLSNVNDGTGNLQTGVRNSYTTLTHSNQTFGVDLDWSKYPTLWKIEAQGGPHVMYGQAVALRVWGGGWLKYGNQTWGVDLQLSSTPAYEWYVVGGIPGNPIDNGEFALWNNTTHDYLVLSHQTWGVDLNWYQKTLPPPPPPPPPPPHGVKTFVAYNCVTEQRPLEMWVADLSSGTGYVDKGTLDSQYAGGGCPGTGQPFTFTPASGHQYLVRSVDYTAPGCSNDPSIADCWRSQTTFIGDAGGQVVSLTIG
jgi:hypothetical protein